MDPELGQRVVSSLAGFLLDSLERSSLETLTGPLTGEVSITAGWVRPRIEAAVSDLTHRGLVVSGDGGLKVKPLPVLGLLFTPDVTVHYHEQPLFALEVKLARAGKGQAALTTAVGQAAVYRESGFPYTAVLAFNAGGLSRTMPSRTHLGGVPVVIRQAPENLPRVREESDLG